MNPCGWTTNQPAADQRVGGRRNGWRPAEVCTAERRPQSSKVRQAAPTDLGVPGASHTSGPSYTLMFFVIEDLVSFVYSIPALFKVFWTKNLIQRNRAEPLLSSTAMRSLLCWTHQKVFVVLVFADSTYKHLVLVVLFGENCREQPEQPQESFW